MLIKAWTKSHGKEDRGILGASTTQQPQWPWPTDEEFGGRLAEATWPKVND